MAKAVWAARAKLLAHLRPFAVPGNPACGLAPPELLPEICGHLRAFAPAELRVLLAAYASHPPDTCVLTLAAAASGADKDGVSEDTQYVRLLDVLVDLLVGGSRLGTTHQLLDAADCIAKHAPCDCRSAKEFWTVFAERVVRLSAANKLEAEHMLRVFAVCATWADRCAPGKPAPAARQTGGAWGHMLRSVGGRLADPQNLDSLELSDVVNVARYAAQLGEAQFRLAAAIGHRVAGKAAAGLAGRDLVDLIGAAGTLGGRLHMMTRALSDQLEPQVPSLPAALLVTLCSHLGALEMFPQRLAVALEEALPTRVPELSTEALLQLLQAAGRLRWRVPAMLEAILKRLQAEEHLDVLDGSALGALLYELYRLDLWEAGLLDGLCKRLSIEGGVRIPHKTAANVLLALSYFPQPTPELYKRLIHELLRAQKLPHQAIFQLKTLEMAVRMGHTEVTFDDLGKLASRWLFAIRKTSAPPEPRAESAFADDVSSVARSIAWKHATEVEVGPYMLDFAGVSEGGNEDGHPHWDDSKPGRSLVRCCVALEADGPSHFYRPHGRPWHWTSMSKLRHRLLTAARIRVAHVPYYDWMQLTSLAEKEAYLSQLLLHVQRAPFPHQKQHQLPDCAGALVEVR